MDQADITRDKKSKQTFLSLWVQSLRGEGMWQPRGVSGLEGIKQHMARRPPAPMLSPFSVFRVNPHGLDDETGIRLDPADKRSSGEPEPSRHQIQKSIAGWCKSTQTHNEGPLYNVTRWTDSNTRPGLRQPSSDRICHVDGYLRSVLAS